MANFPNATDQQLDDAFAAYVAAGDWNGADMVQQDIIARLTTVTSFLSGLFGGSRFPKYDAILAATGGSFTQAQAAQSATQVAAQNVVNTTVSGVKSIAQWSQSTLLVVAVIVVAGLVLWKGRK